MAVKILLLFWMSLIVNTKISNRLAQSKKLSLNESKTKLLLFRPINKLNLALSNIKLNKNFRTLAMSLTYLGIEIYKTLSWGNQSLAKNLAELTEFFLD